MQRLRQVATLWAVCFAVLIYAIPVQAAPYAAFVIDARSGEVLHSRNADTKLHPASLTKMMTLYVVFDAIRRGEITLDTKVKVSKYAASQPASKLYLKAGQRIKLRYLIRASAVKSANDAALVMAEAVSGSEAAFADRMTKTARALGMSKTTFKNPHGLTRAGHLSTARDMTKLGRALFYHYPEYYNLFSRRSTDAGGKTVYNTNRKLLSAYSGADGIKTGYTRAAGFNLVASAERRNVRIIATMFGGSSGASRNARVAELLDMGFKRAPRRVAVRAPGRPNVSVVKTAAVAQVVEKKAPAKSVAKKPAPTQLAVAKSLRPTSRPKPATAPIAPTAIAGLQDSIEESLQGIAVANAASTAALPPSDTKTASLDSSIAVDGPAGSPAVTRTDTSVMSASAFAATQSPPPRPRPAIITFSSSDSVAQAQPKTEIPATVVPRMSTSGNRHWGISVGTYNSRYEAERVLLKTALVEIGTLDSALRKVVKTKRGFSADFVGLDERSAAFACERLQARNQTCTTFGP